jgi:hypothetical protein
MWFQPPRFVSLEGKGREGVRPFESLADISKVAKHLSIVNVKLLLAEAMGVDIQAAAEQDRVSIDIDDYVRTGLVKALIQQGNMDSSPLTSADISSLREHVRSNDYSSCQATITKATAEQWGDTIFGLEELAFDWSEQLIKPIYNMIQAIEDPTIDPKYLSGLIVDVGARS